MSELNATVHRSVCEVNANQWNHVVEKSPIGGVFHRHRYLRVLEETVHDEARHVVVYKGDNPVGVFPHFVGSLAGTPFSVVKSLSPGYGGPTILTDELDVLKAMVRALDRASDRTDLSYSFNAFDTEAAKFGRPLRELGYRPSVQVCTFSLDLTNGWEEIWSGMSNSRRNHLRNAHESDYDVVDHTTSADRWPRFHETYLATMDRVGGEPYPLEFFTALREQCEDLVKLFAVEVDGKTVGWHFYVRDDDRSTLHHYFSGVEAEYFEYKPSELLHEHAITWAIEEGYDRYDFGGTAADPEDGLFIYKKSYGGDVRPLYAWERPVSRIRKGFFDVAKAAYTRVRR